MMTVVNQKHHVPQWGLKEFYPPRVWIMEWVRESSTWREVGSRDEGYPHDVLPKDWTASINGPGGFWSYDPPPHDKDRWPNMGTINKKGVVVSAVWDPYRMEWREHVFVAFPDAPTCFIEESAIFGEEEFRILQNKMKMTFDHEKAKRALKELTREKGLRERCYPRWIDQGSMTPASAEAHLKALDEAIEIVQEAVEGTRPPELFG
jgi:hypothetical protein